MWSTPEETFSGIKSDLYQNMKVKGTSGLMARLSMSIFKYFFRSEPQYQCAGCKKMFLADEVCPNNQGLIDYLYCRKCWPKS